MSENNEHHGLGERLVEAYNRMLERVRQRSEHGHGLQEAIDHAQERATELGELSREEAQRVGDYLRRDLHDAASFISSSGKELGDWLQFDLELVERSLLDLFASAVDQSRVQLAELSMRANALGEWRTGEVAAIGTLQCKSCGELLHLHGTAHIPPCPRCHGTTFRRLPDEEA